MATKTLGAGVFKQTCLALLDEVANDHIELVVTKRGRPVARVVPIESNEELERTVLAELRGRGQMMVGEREFLQPTGELAGWDPEALA
ncbi:MAG: type II toxin-antitoxin system Phd/YefM family antitoxin [Myxococcota bacterium]